MFSIDERILNSSVFVCESRLSTVLVKNDSRFPWLLLVPRVEGVQEITQLSPKQQLVLMEEIDLFSRVLQASREPDKLNIGALGNMVSQLHIHIVARFKTDIAWPHSVWQPLVDSCSYEPQTLEIFIERLKEQMTSLSKPACLPSFPK